MILPIEDKANQSWLPHLNSPTVSPISINTSPYLDHFVACNQPIVFNKGTALSWRRSNGVLTMAIFTEDVGDHLFLSLVSFAVTVVNLGSGAKLRPLPDTTAYLLCMCSRVTVAFHLLPDISTVYVLEEERDA